MFIKKNRIANSTDEGKAFMAWSTNWPIISFSLVIEILIYGKCLMGIWYVVTETGNLRIE